MQEHFYNELGLYYRTNTFVPGRTTLVFVHGLSGSSSAWKLFEEHFENSYNILTFDIRGHGKSKKYTHYEDYKISYFADDLQALVTHLKLGPFVLVSHSLGTIIAFAYLEKYQSHVSAAVFLSPILTAWNSKGAGILSLLLRVTRIFEFFPFRERTAGHIDYARFPNSGDWNIPRMIADVSNTSVRVYLYSTRQSLLVDFTELTHKISVPLLVVHGKKDSISPLKNSLTLHEHAKNSTLVLLDSADHIVPLNHAPRVCEEIEHFLASHNLA